METRVLPSSLTSEEFSDIRDALVFVEGAVVLLEECYQIDMNVIPVSYTLILNTPVSGKDCNLVHIWILLDLSLYFFRLPKEKSL